ncbi:MAG: phosphoenolpyruvate carboxykinase (ATP) [Acidobacteria bacterium]|nr:phosphoenolpyruvate carboxykinase (ATP) [Acidobacteriota bacterium]
MSRDTVANLSSLTDLTRFKKVFYNLSVPTLIEESLRHNQGVLSRRGAISVLTGKYTGRSPKDKFIVEEETTRNDIWWGEVNRPAPPEVFERLLGKVLTYLEKRAVFVFDGFAGADPNYRLAVRFINEFPWQNLFVHQLFLRPTAKELGNHRADFTVICAPGLQADPDVDGTRSEAFILLNLRARMVLIGGTHYAGEMKKSIFTVMNFLMPQRGVMPMHCSANVGKEGDVALFFGLSGTGKTTLSADSERHLIGDDEHGWSDDGVFNFEGGCYAKCIGLARENEPQIWEAIRFGSVLENVVVDGETREVDYASDRYTENTRAAYPVDFIPGARIPGMAGHPSTILFLAADASGVLPPVSRLSFDQAMFYFLNGYTSKLAGTERGVTEPQATFSTCFGAPFLPLHPSRYAAMLGERIKRHKSNVYLLNTGWTGGGYGQGRRIKLPYTRAMVTAALNGDLQTVAYDKDPVFDLMIPRECPHVPPEVLVPRNTWKDKTAFDQKAKELADRFAKNFEKYKHADS